jgi:hypothetical protein
MRDFCTRVSCPSRTSVLIESNVQGPKCLINVTALIAIQCHLQQVYAILS